MGSHAPVQNDRSPSSHAAGAGWCRWGGRRLTGKQRADGWPRPPGSSAPRSASHLEALSQHGVQRVSCAGAGEMSTRRHRQGGARQWREIDAAQTNQLIERGLEFVYNRNMSHDTLAAPGKCWRSWFVRRQRLKNNHHLASYRVQLDITPCQRWARFDALYPLKGWDTPPRRDCKTGHPRAGHGDRADRCIVRTGQGAAGCPNFRNAARLSISKLFRDPGLTCYRRCRR